MAKIRLPPFNGGRPLQGVQIQLRDGSKVTGLLKEELSATVRVFVEDKVLPVEIRREDISEVTPVEESVAPEAVVQDDRTRSLGGVGIHTRRKAYACSAKHEIGAIVSNFESTDALSAMVAKMAPHVRFPTDRAEVFEEDGQLVAPVLVKGHVLPSICYAFAIKDVYVYVPGVQQGSIMCDSLNRGLHLYAQQAHYERPEDVGPTRALWRFGLSHIPPSWDHLPFSWHAYALLVLKDLERDGELHRIAELELPLRSFVEQSLDVMLDDRVSESRRRVEECDAALFELCLAERELSKEADELRADALSRLRFAQNDDAPLENMVLYRLLLQEGRGIVESLGLARAEMEMEKRRAHENLVISVERRARYPPPSSTQKYVIPTLGEEDSKVLLDSFHAFNYNHSRLTDADRTVKKIRLQQYPLCTGYFPHWISSYLLTGNYVGFGGELRKPLPANAKVPPNVRNRMRVVNGRLKGRGNQGYKGLFAPKKSQKSYVPKRQLVRTELDDLHLKKVPDTVMI